MKRVNRQTLNTNEPATRLLAADLVTMISENIAAGRCNDHPTFWAEQRVFWTRVRDEW